MNSRKLLRKLLRKIQSLGLILALFSLVVVSGCGQSSNTSTTPQPAKSGEPQKGGTLKIAVSADASSSSNIGYPANLFDTAGLFYSSVALETLVGVDENGQPVPMLATKWEVGKDQKSITMTLRKEVKFHDGSDWNADVAKWNLETLKAEKSSQFLAALVSVDRIDDFTIRLNLSRWDAGIYGNLSTYAGPMISQKAFESNGKDWAMAHPIGTGPFKFVTWERDVKQVYEKFDGYWQKGKPNLRAIEWYIIPDPMVQVASLKTGEVDVIWNLNTKQAKTFQTDANYTISTTVNRLVGFAGDSKNPNSVFANQKVRQAIDYAIDKKGIADTIGDAFWVPVWQPARPGSYAENPEVISFRYDTQMAKDLLKDAGYPDGFKTKLYVQSVQPQPDLAVAMQGYLKAIGIDAQVQVLDSAKYYDMASNGWSDGLFFMGATVSVPDELLLLSKAHGPGFKGYVSQKVPVEIQNLIVKALAAPDFESKKATTREIMKAESESAVVSWLAFQQGVTVSSKEVHNHGIYGKAGAFMWTPAEATKDK